MKSGSREIQKRMKQQVPRGDEPMKSWIAKAAKFYQVDYTTLENIYYRPNRSIPNEMYTTLRNLTGSTPIRTNHPHLNELKTKLEEQDKNISRLEKILEREITFKRKLGELLAQH